MNPSSTPIYKYAAFISYRHGGSEGRWAAWLHRGLESYRIPSVLAKTLGRRKLGKVFRDEEELAASADLSREILDALQDSRYLIVVCSPRTAASEWVNREILQFREWGRQEQILTLLVEGEPAQAFPPALREIRVPDGESQESVAVYAGGYVEPLAADARPQPGVNTKTVRQVALLKLIATMLGVSFDELRRREQLRQAQARRWLSLMVGLLLVVLTTLSTIAWIQKSNADHQRRLAEERGAEASARLNALLVKSGVKYLDEGDLNQSLPWFLAAMKHESADADRHFIHRLRVEATIQHCPKLVYSATGSQVALSPDNDTLALVHNDECQLISLKRGNSLFPAWKVEVGARAVFSLDGRYLAIFRRQCTIYDVRKGTPLSSLVSTDRWIRRVRFIHDDQELIVKTDEGEQRFQVATGDAMPWLDGLEVLAANAELIVRHCAFNENHAVVVRERMGQTTEKRWLMEVWECKSLTKLRDLDIDFSLSSIEAISLSEDSSRAAIVYAESGTLHRLARCWSVADGKPLAPVYRLNGGINEVALSPDGLYLLTTVASDLGAMQGRRTLPADSRVFEVENGKPVGLPVVHRNDAIRKSLLNSTGEYFATQGDNSCRVWDTITTQPVTPPLPVPEGDASIEFDPTGRFLITNGGGHVAIWDLAITQNRVPMVSSHEHYRASPYFTHAGYLGNGEQVATVGFYTAHLWDSLTGQQMDPWPDQLHAQAQAINSQRDRLAIADIERPASENTGSVVTARVLDVSKREWFAEPYRWEGKRDENSQASPLVRLSPETGKLVISRPSGQVRVISYDTKTTLHELDHGSPIQQMELDATGQWLVTCGGRKLKQWDLKTGLLHAEYDAQTEVSRVIIGQKNFFVAALVSNFSHTGRLLIWRQKNIREEPFRTAFQTGVHALAVSNDETLMATGATDGTVQIWKWNSAENTLAVATPVMKHSTRVNSLMFDSKARLLLTGSGDPPPAWTEGFSRIWNVRDGTPVTPWSLNPQEVDIVDFHPTQLKWMALGKAAGFLHEHQSFDVDTATLSALGELYASAYLDDTPSLVVLSNEKRIANDRLVSNWLHDSSWQTTPEQLKLWHLDRALKAEDASWWRVARLHLDAVVQAGSEDGFVFARQARACLELDKWEQCIAASDKALALRVNSPDLHYYRGMAYRALGQWEEAEQSLLRSIEHCDAVVFWGQADLDYILELAAVQSERGKRHAALETLRRVNLVGNEFQLEELAQQYEQQGYYRAAITAYDWLLELFPETEEWLRQRARLWMRSRQASLAVDDLQELLKLPESTPADWHSLAKATLAAGDYVQADIRFGEAIEHGCNEVSAWMSWMLLAAREGNAPKFVERREQLLTKLKQAGLQPTLEVALAAIAIPTSKDTEQLRDVFESLESAFENSPGNEQGLVLCCMLVRMEQSEAAIEGLRKLKTAHLGVDDEQARICFLALALRAQNKPAEAEHELAALNALDRSHQGNLNWWWSSFLEITLREAQRQ